MGVGRHSLSIATFNIRTDTEMDGPPGSRYRWASRFSAVKKVITMYNWDIIGIQEAREHQLRDLLTIPGYEAAGEKRSNDEGGEYSSIFYKKETFHLLETETEWLSPSQEKYSLAEEWGAAYPRVFTTAKLEEKATGKRLWVINTHFDHVSEEARYQSAKQIVNQLKELDQDLPILLTGDFNGSMGARWYQVIAQQLNNVRSLSPHHIGPDATFRGVDFFRELDWGNLESLDYIFCNRNVEVQQTRTVTDQFEGLYPSDHFAFSAQIMLK